jgi:hypothetical protein
MRLFSATLVWPRGADGGPSRDSDSVARAPRLSRREEFDMQRHLSLMGLSLLLALSACGFSSSQKIAPDFKQNPHPKQAYQLTMTIANAPGPFASVEGFMQFDVSSRECLPPSSENGGHLWPLPNHNVPIVWTRINDTQYIGMVYMDGMMDEDYYGLGICHWKLVQAIAELKATKAKTDTRFMPNIHPDKLEARQAEITYLIRAEYPRHPEAASEDPVSFGRTDRSKMTHLLDDEIFSVTFTSAAATP